MSPESPTPLTLEVGTPSKPIALFSRLQRERLVARASHALYRWYLDRSQSKRNWNPDRGFGWQSLAKGHSRQLLSVVEGFYAVEQFAPDYTVELTRLVRPGDVPAAS